jgi:hypothetical protein
MTKVQGAYTARDKTINLSEKISARDKVRYHCLITSCWQCEMQNFCHGDRKLKSEASDGRM